MAIDQAWECVIVGGGVAGLSAALVLGRARRTTLVIDAGQQSNRAAPGIGGLLGHDQQSPADLYATGRREIAAYPSIEYRQGHVLSGVPVDGGFAMQLATGETLHARRVLLATGMRYYPPNIPGLEPLWGTSVFQCPFCHGWEMRDRKLAALASGDDGVHAALMLRGWSDDVVLLTDGPSRLSAAQVKLLATARVSIDERRIAELVGQGDQLTAVAYVDGERLPCDGLLVEAPLRQPSLLAKQLGASCHPGPIDVDALHRTDVPTVFAAGDICTEQPHIAGAIASGSQAAMIIVQSLLSAEFGLPYPPE